MSVEKKKTTLGKVAVIGGCGFLGTNIVQLLLKRYPDSQIAVVDVRTTKRQFEGPNVSYHDCDITNLLDVEELFLKLKPDVVFHTAALLPFEGRPDQIIYKVNVEGTNNLIITSQNSSVKAFVFTSSSSVVIGDVEEVINADESWPVLLGKDQPEFYSGTKALAETAVIKANRSRPNFLTCSLRPAGMFGEFDNTFLYRALKIRGFRTRFQIGSNDNIFDATHIENVAHAHLLAANALLETQAMKTPPLDTERVDGEAFNITNGTPIYFWDFMRRTWLERGTPEDKNYSLGRVWVLNASIAYVIAGLLEFFMGFFGKLPTFNKFAVRNSAMTRYFDITKAKQRLNYEAVVSVEEGIKRGVAECWPRILREEKEASGK